MLLKNILSSFTQFSFCLNGKYKLLPNWLPTSKMLKYSTLVMFLERADGFLILIIVILILFSCNC